MTEVGSYDRIARESSPWPNWAMHDDAGGGKGTAVARADHRTVCGHVPPREVHPEVGACQRNGRRVALGVDCKAALRAIEPHDRAGFASRGQDLGCGR